MVLISKSKIKSGEFMKTTKVTASDKSADQFEGDLLVYCVPEAVDKKLRSDPAIEKEVTQAYELGDFSGKEGQTLLLYPSFHTQEGSDLKDQRTSARRIAAVGLGKLNSEPDPSGSNEIRSDKKSRETDPGKREGALRELFRKAGGSVAALSAKVKALRIMICLPELEGVISQADMAESLAEGVLLGDYRFLKYKKEKPDDPEYKGLAEVKFYSQSSTALIRKALKLAVASAQAVCEARDMANEPGNGWRASDFASYALHLAKKYDLTCSVLDKSKMKKLGMGGVIAVNQGSSEPPQMVILEYQPEGNKPQSKKAIKKGKAVERESDTILLVGKGITFDSGGISLKQAAGMEDMKYDMCGGAAVLAVMQAVGQERPDGVGVVAIVPATDNLSGSNAVKPGDVIRHYNGVTSEIVNTDAEGRLVLADALAYGIELFKPDCVVDIATLTGAAIMGLGHHFSALLSNSDELVARLEAASERACEPLWRLPLGKEYTKQIESKVADIKNTGGKSAGTITAAAYLEKFVGDTPWAHIDIAGTAWDFTEKSYIPKGPSGIGVRTFLELIRSWTKMEKNME